MQANIQRLFWKYRTIYSIIYIQNYRKPRVKYDINKAQETSNTREKYDKLGFNYDPIKRFWENV